MTRYRGISAFAAAFAAEYSGFMKTHRVTNLQIAEKLGRNDGYVSERATGKRPLDTDDVDALASLVPGWSGRTLMIELANRTRSHMAPPSGIVIHRDFTPAEDDALAAASESADTREDDRSDEGFL